MKVDALVTLVQLRQQVDKIDSQLLALLKERLVVTSRMREAKNQQALPLRDAEREQEVLSRISKLNKDSIPHLPGEPLEVVFRTIMDWSLAAQKELEEDQSSSRSQ